MPLRSPALLCTILVSTWCLNLLAAEQTAADKNLIEFAKYCSTLSQKRGLPRKSKPVIFVLLRPTDESGDFSDDYVIVKSPYMIGLQHRDLWAKYNESGRTAALVYAGEALENERGEFTQIINTSGWNWTEKMALVGPQATDKAKQIIETLAPQLKPPRGIKTLEHTKDRKHIDPLFNFPPSENVRHDELFTIGTGAWFNAKGLADNYPEKDKIRESPEWKFYMEHLPSLKLYVQTVKRDVKGTDYGIKTELSESMIRKLENLQKNPQSDRFPTKEEFDAWAEEMRQFMPRRSDDPAREKLIQVINLPARP